MIQALFFLSILILSQAATLIRFTNASSLAICFWRLAFASALLLPVLGPARLKTLGQRFLQAGATALLLSGVFLFLHFYFFFRSVQETTVANATILLCLSPVTTAIGAWFLFRERVTTHLVLACALGFVGVVCLFGERVFTPGSMPATSFWGDIWGVLSAVCFSVYILTGKRIRQTLDNISYAFAIYLQTAVYAAIAMLFLDVPFTGYDTTTWWMFLALAILPTLMGHAIFTYCLNHMNVNFMSCMTLVEPIFAAIAAMFLFNEPLTIYAVSGFSLTAASVLVLYWPSLTPGFRRMFRKRSVAA